MSGKKRRGLSLDDKRSTILKIYHEKQEPFNLKEIETLASKAGVTQQTVKEVNQSLVDDHMVHMDKIGSANFFWSFPARAYQEAMQRQEILQKERENIQTTTREVQEKITEEKKKRQRPDQAKLLQERKSLQEELKNLDNQLETWKYNDPAILEEIQRKVKEVKDGCEFWTDQCFALKSYLVKKRGMASKEAEKVLRMDSNFDYLA